MENIHTIALAMVKKGKGILAADESNGTMAKRLESVKIPSTEANRLSFRETLFTSPKIKNFISGVILYDETIKQTASNGQNIAELLNEYGVIPGIKVDKGLVPLALCKEEKVTEGLDGLNQRLLEYYKLGARFTKWRAIYNISNIHPSKTAILTKVVNNANGAATDSARKTDSLAVASRAARKKYAASNEKTQSKPTTSALPASVPARPTGFAATYAARTAWDKQYSANYNPNGTLKTAGSPAVDPKLKKVAEAGDTKSIEDAFASSGGA